MDLYLSTSRATSRIFTNAYSSSFSLASRLFSKKISQHIYAIYGLTRIADEIVDTYRGDDTRLLLDELECEVYSALKRGYSTNPIVHSFQDTATQYGIGEALLTPFFESMRTDIASKSFSQAEYEQYIYGSAEVVGLMCLRVFVEGNDTEYTRLSPNAGKLGSAFQKVNFLRDFSDDYRDLGRCYFPGVTYDSFNEVTKSEIIADVKSDFALALPSIKQLPVGSRRAVAASYRYYSALLSKLEHTTASTIKQKRVRINNFRKVLLLI